MKVKTTQVVYVPGINWTNKGVIVNIENPQVAKAYLINGWVEPQDEESRGVLESAVSNGDLTQEEADMEW